MSEPGWIETEPGVWRNPATGGVSTPAPCGWCGRSVVWPVHGYAHSWGRCVEFAAARDREKQYSPRTPARPSSPAPATPDVPTTLITIAWSKAEEKDFIHRMSRALATKISERFPNAAVNVRTFGTVDTATAPPAVLPSRQPTAQEGK